MSDWNPDHAVAEMTLPEKIGQMTQVSVEAVEPRDVADHAIGSVMSGGNDNPQPNEPHVWVDLVDSFLEAAHESRHGIPLVYGIDAVHGHSNVRGATVFPHNIGLGAIGDEDLVRRIGQITATEMIATGIRWTFAPAVSVAHDVRWGRTYESYGRQPDLVARLAPALIEGLAEPDGPYGRVLACPKHYVGDGGTTWGSVDRKPWMQWWDGWGPAWSIDQGDARLSEPELRDVHLAPYEPAIRAGAMSVMASYSSWNGDKLHGHRHLLTEVLKQELAFDGFIVSDWMGVDQLDASYEHSVVMAINAGVDMVMVPFDFERFIGAVTEAVSTGSIPMARIDDAVIRILRAKQWLTSVKGFDVRPELDVVGAAHHRRVAAEAARRSAVLLKNERAIPMAVRGPILVGGRVADDIGLQCGGWTAGWQGSAGPTVPGTTLLEALRQTLDDVVYEPSGSPADEETFDLGIACIAEEPYAEGPGDREVPTARSTDRAVVERMRSRCRTLILVIYSGRPLAVADLIESADAVIAAWLPGSEAGELPRLLLGQAEFEGRLPQPWPMTNDAETPNETAVASLETPPRETTTPEEIR